MGVAFRDLSGQIVMDVVAELRALDIPGETTRTHSLTHSLVLLLTAVTSPWGYYCCYHFY